MKTFPLAKAALTVLFGLLLWNYFSGLVYVPFHPDESTQIFMSADATLNPGDLTYLPAAQLDDRMRYRLIDSPLTRTMIGWGMALQSQQPNSIDWNWSDNWENNVSGGALPASEALMAARWSVAWLFPLSCLFLFLLANKLGGRPMAVITVILFSTNALILMHTRRAMAESALICTMCALTWLLVDFRKTPWLTALVAGLAVNAKQTAIPLAAIGGLEMILFPQGKTWRNWLTRIGIFLAVIVGITWIFNPVMWKFPIETLREGLSQRADLSSRMQADYKTSHNPLEQSIILIAQVFIQPPAAADVLNYSEATKSAEEAYSKWPLNNLFRGFAGGAILIILTIAGWILLWKKVSTNLLENRKPLLIFLLITFVCVFTLMFFTSAPFQRYYTILIPLFSVAQAASICAIWFGIEQNIKKGTARSGSPV